MKINEVVHPNQLKETASAGATGVGAIATTPTGLGSNVGTLFGGTYKQKKIKSNRKK